MSKAIADDELEASIVDVLNRHFPSSGSLMPVNAMKRIMQLIQARDEQMQFKGMERLVNKFIEQDAFADDFTVAQLNKIIRGLKNKGKTEVGGDNQD